jgi:hypothetical protein
MYLQTQPWTQAWESSMTLLRRFLSPAQRTQMDEESSFTEICRRTRKAIIIRITCGGITVSMTGYGCLCIRTDCDLPAPDQALIMLLAIRTDEEAWLTTVNHEGRRWPPFWKMRDSHGRFA